MNVAQVHLMLNHVPIVGTLFTLVLVAIAAATGSRNVLRVALATAVAVALITIPVFLTGEPVEEMVENLPGVSESLVERHEDASKIALGLVLAFGLVAIIGLIRLPRELAPRRLAMLVLLVNLGTAAQMAWTAHLGGQIRHTEIRAEAAHPDEAREERHEFESD